MRSGIATVVFIGLATLMACRDDGNTSHRPSHPVGGEAVPRQAEDSEKTSPSVMELREATARKNEGLLADELKLSDQAGTWRTEAFHELIKPKLKKLGEVVSGKSTAVPAELLSEEFSCTALRPEDLRRRVVYRDSNLTVFRSALPLKLKAAHHGSSGLEQALNALASTFDADGGAVKFKVFRVAIEGQNAECETYVDTDGQGPKSNDSQPLGVQQNMVWHCRWRLMSDDDWKLSSITLKQFEEVHYHRTKAGRLFSDCTESVLAGNDCFRTHLQHGIDHWRFRFEERFGIDSVSLAGLAVADVNGDGLDDFYFCDVGGLPNRLFLQQADGSAIEAAAAAGVDWMDRSYGALFADLDNDGDQDLIVSVSVSLLLMENDGSGKFKVRERLQPHPTAQSLSAVDYDNDGRLDLYVCCYGNGFETFADSKTPLPWHDANNGAPNSLFRSEGGWKFRDVTVDVGLDVNNRRFSYAASWEDFDNDGDQDLYVANDFGRNNLYVNKGGRFQDEAQGQGVEDMSSGMSVDWGDYDNDGQMDLYVSNMFSSAGNRIAYQERFMDGSAQPVIGSYRRFARGNTLFRRNERGGFEDTSLSAGVTMGRWAWSSLFVDINNDGWRDLLVANGHVTGVQPDDL